MRVLIVDEGSLGVGKGVVAGVDVLGEGGGVGNGKGHIEDLCQGLGKQRLAGASGANQQDVAFLQLYIGF